MEITAIEINQVPKKLKRGQIEHIERIHDLIRLGAERLGLEVNQTEREETANSAAYRGDPVDFSAYLKSLVPEISIPETMGFKDWAKREDGTGVVAKNTTEAHGKGKYFLEEPEQVAKFKEWGAGRRASLEEGWVFQEHIDCRGDRLVAFRVIADCTGAVAAGQLMYSHVKGKERVRIEDRFPQFLSIEARKSAYANAGYLDRSVAIYARREFEEYKGYMLRQCDTAELEIPGETLFLNAKAIAANRMFQNEVLGSVDPKGYGTDPKNPRITTKKTQIGGLIALNGGPLAHPVSKAEAAILEANGLNPKLPEIPEQIGEASSKLARKLGIVGGVVRQLWVAADWVQDQKGQYYLTEVNFRPGLGAVRDTFGGMDRMGEQEAELVMLKTTFDHLAALMGQ